jgi:hypothetical protein
MTTVRDVCTIIIYRLQDTYLNHVLPEIIESDQS